MKTKIGIVACLFLFSFSANAQTTFKKVVSYSKGINDTRVMVLKSDNTMWWTANSKTWNAVPKKGLPETEILDLEVYLKTGYMSMESRLVCLLKDNSIWWYADGKSWEKIESKGLPAGKSISDVTVYVKNGGMSESTRMIVLLDDNSLWWFAPGKEWERLSNDVASK